MSSSKSPIAISEVIRLPENTWLNDGFTGVVREVTEKVAKTSNKKFWVLIIADPKTNEVVEAACFAYPGLQGGDQIDVTGQGIKRAGDFHGTVKVSWGEKATVEKIGRNVAHETAAAAPANGATLPTGDFHSAMKREALLLAHCIFYAAKVVEKIGAVGMTDLAKGLNSPEHIRCLATSLAIRAEKQGLSSIVPALDGKTNGHPAPAAPASAAAPADRSASPAPATTSRPAGGAGRLTEEQQANLVDRGGRAIPDEDAPF